MDLNFQCKYFSSFLSVALTWREFSWLVLGPRARLPARSPHPTHRAEAAAGHQEAVPHALACLRNRKRTPPGLLLPRHIPHLPFPGPRGTSLGDQTVGGRVGVPAGSVGRRPPWGRRLTRLRARAVVPWLSPEGPAGPLLPNGVCLSRPHSTLYTPLTLEMEWLLLGPHS